MGWQGDAQKIWGQDWIAPISEVLDINRRTIERWRAGEGAPRENLQTELRRLSMHPCARQIGILLRRMANGESLDEIRADIRNYRIAINYIERELGKYNSIAILAARDEIDETD